MRTILLAAAAALALGGCAAIQSTSDIAVDYNRSFAESRNEVLLLNTLRAAAREPLQFSTMGAVNGTVGNGATLTIPFTNVVAGGRDVISPSLNITDSVNPNVSIVPLAVKEFTTGILTPISTSNIQLFLHTGWDAEFLLPLIVGGVVCPDGRLLLNSGEYEVRGSTAAHDAFRDFFFESARQFNIATLAGSPTQTFTVSEERAIALIRDGVGPNHVLRSVEDIAAGGKRVTIAPAPTAIVSGLDIESLCDRTRDREGVRLEDSTTLLGAVEAAPRSGRPQGRVVFRSVAAIIQYLGEGHRVRMQASTVQRHGLDYLNRERQVRILWRVESGIGPGPDRAVQTAFHDRVFYVPRLDLEGQEGEDRTLKTLSFIDQLIALQTNESTVRNAQPLIAIQQ